VHDRMLLLPALMSARVARLRCPILSPGGIRILGQAGRRKKNRSRDRISLDNRVPFMDRARSNPPPGGETCHNDRSLGRSPAAEAACDLPYITSSFMRQAGRGWTRGDGAAPAAEASAAAGMARSGLAGPGTDGTYSGTRACKALRISSTPASFIIDTRCRIPAQTFSKSSGRLLIIPKLGFAVQQTNTPVIESYTKSI